MPTIDLKKANRDWYAPESSPSMIELPPLPYLMVDGSGEPDPATNSEYREAVESLFPVAYALRKEIKDRTGDAYVVMPLEGLWWADDMEVFVTGDRNAWQWTLMIRIPPDTDESLVTRVIEYTTNHKGLPAEVRLALLDEGTVAQVMHLGPYSAEGPVIAGLHDFIEEQGHDLAGLHHEIYLSDPRKVDPARLRTILRQPMQAR